MFVTAKKMARRQGSRNRAFTLIELLVVMVVLAVIAAIVIPKFFDQGRRAKETSLRSDLKLLRNAVATFQADTGYYPKTLGDLTVATVGALSTPNKGLDTAGADQTILAADFHGPYIQGTIPPDPVSATAFKYGVAGGLAVGEVRSSATGNALDGATAYSSF